MRLTLTTDDGEVLDTWAVPDELRPVQVDEAIAEGFHRNHRLDRCDECGGFFRSESLIETHDDEGPRATCQRCMELPH